MKKDIHPDWKKTTVVCNGCNTTFESHSTVDKITVEICSNCHPFYTGKQKLVDVAGRVDRFRAREAAAKPKAEPKTQKAKSVKAQAKTGQHTLADLKRELTQKQPEEQPTKT